MKRDELGKNIKTNRKAETQVNNGTIIFKWKCYCLQTVRVLWGQTNFYSSTIDANQSQAALIGVAKSRAFRTQFQSVIDLSPSVNTILDIHFQFLPLYGLLCHSIHELRCQGGQKFCHQFQPLTAIQSNEVEVTFRYNSLSKFIWFIHHALLIREQAALLLFRRYFM